MFSQCLAMHIAPDESGHTPLSELEIAPIFGIPPDVLAGDQPNCSGSPSCWKSLGFLKMGETSSLIIKRISLPTNWNRAVGCFLFHRCGSEKGDLTAWSYNRLRVTGILIDRHKKPSLARKIASFRSGRTPPNQRWGRAGCRNACAQEGSRLIEYSPLHTGIPRDTRRNLHVTVHHSSYGFSERVQDEIQTGRCRGTARRTNRTLGKRSFTHTQSGEYIEFPN